MIRTQRARAALSALCALCASVLLLLMPIPGHTVAVSGAPATPDSSANPIQARIFQLVLPGAPVRVLMYNSGVMERVARCHMSITCGDTGDYVPTLRLRKDVDGYTAVNWANRKLVGMNAVVVADLLDPVRHVWVRQRLQPTDWQQLRHATGWKLEVNGTTARRLHFYSRTTVARIVRVER